MSHFASHFASRFASGVTSAVVIAATVLGLPKAAAAAPTQGWISTTLEGGVANLRSQPQSTAPVQATARNGSAFDILGDRTDEVGYTWFQIRPAGITPTEQTWVRSDLVSFAEPIAAAPTMSCDGAIVQVETQLRAVPNVSILQRRSSQHFYRNNVPSDRQGMASFDLGGSGAASVMASRVLMNQMAAQIIENCPETGLVSFLSDDYEDGYIHYGYMPEGTVRPFQCRRDVNRNTNLPDWGERICAQ